MKEIEMIQTLIEGIRLSVEMYETYGKNGVSRENTATSIQRRIMVAREELLKLSKSLE